MKRSMGKFLGMLVVMSVLAVFGGSTAWARDKGGFTGAAHSTAGGSANFVTPYYFPSFGGFGAYGFYGGYYSPFIDPAPRNSTQPYLPKYWWVERYPSDDPRQSGYNPNSGYAREEVTTLLLSTYPVKARVVLDGVFVGTSDNLGPMQLPVGLHTLRIEAAGFEPSQSVMNIEEPAMQQLEVRLKPLGSAAAK
jgi:hypothetical protein